MQPGKRQNRLAAVSACLCLGLAGVTSGGGGSVNPDTNRPAEATPTTAAAASLPTVDALMKDLLARLPAQTILVSGDLTTVATNGVKTKLAVDILLAYPETAIYTVRDTFGRELEKLTVTRDGPAASLSYESNGTNTPAPPLAQRIQNTALTWMDLTLGFLWWDGGRIIGQMETRGQPCYVLDRHAPAGSATPYASVRMWVDQRVSMLLQAEGYDMLGDCIRRLSVKSFKKINDEWMVKDLEFEELPEGPRTVLRVRNAEPVKSDQPAAGLP